jgi:hypothetical protein
MTSFKRVLQGVCAGIAIVFPAIASEKTGEAERFTTTYDFYIGGLSIAEISFIGDVSPLGYTADSTVETRGFLDLIVSGRVNAVAEGYRHTKGHLAPDRYETDYTARDEARTVSIAYSGEVADVSITPPEPPKPYDTDASEHPGALDPVTAAVTMMDPRDPADLCNRTIPIFDGKRRYDIVLLPLSRRPEGNNPPLPTWDKPMQRCFGVYERIAGFEGELQTEQKYFPFDIWFEDDGEGLYRVVRLSGRTKLGYAIGTLRK